MNAKLAYLAVPALFIWGCSDNPCEDDPQSEACQEYQTEVGDGESNEVIPPPGIEDLLISKITLNQGAQIELMSADDPIPEPEPEPEPESQGGDDLGMSCTSDDQCSLGLCIPFVGQCGEPCTENNDCANDPDCCPISGGTECLFGVCVGGNQGGGGGGAGSGDDVETRVIANRAGLLRVFVETKEDFQTRELQMILKFSDGAEYLKQIEVESNSENTDLETTFNFDIPADQLTNGASFHVELKETYGGSIQRWPSEDESELDTISTGTLRVVLVPVRYNADGSGRLPDVSDEQVDIYRDWIASMYPLEKLELTVREPMDFNTTVQTQGWTNLLQAIMSLRSQDNPADDVYYYGLINPNTTFASYCSGGCVAGLSTLGTVGDPSSRASTGVGFSGTESADTLVHELGHAHGREHAPCGLLGQPSDPGYPYDDAEIGVLGYDSDEGALKSSSSYVDFMSYCYPIWLSDYTFTGLAYRMNALTGQQAMVRGNPKTYRVLIEGDDGRLSWGQPMRLRVQPAGVPVDIELFDHRQKHMGTTTVPMALVTHLSGGFLYIPELEPDVAFVQYGVELIPVH